MGSTYSTVLAVGERAAVEDAVARYGERVAIVAVDEGRWALIPDDYDATPLAVLASANGGLAARFWVFDSSTLVAEVYRDGAPVHVYLSEQRHVEQSYDPDAAWDSESWMEDMIGRRYEFGVEPPHGPLGADAEPFVALGVEPVDRAELGRILREPDPEETADSQHHEMLHALNLENVSPLQWDYERASNSANSASGGESSSWHQ